MSMNFKMLLQDIGFRSQELQEKHHSHKDRTRIRDDLNHNRDFYEQATSRLPTFAKNIERILRAAPVATTSEAAIPVQPDSSKLSGPSSSSGA